MKLTAEDFEAIAAIASDYIDDNDMPRAAGSSFWPPDSDDGANFVDGERGLAIHWDGKLVEYETDEREGVWCDWAVIRAAGPAVFKALSDAITAFKAAGFRTDHLHDAGCDVVLEMRRRRKLTAPEQTMLPL